MAARTYLFAISLGAHAALGVALAAIPARVRHEVIAITMTETPKPKAVQPADPPPPPDPPRAEPHRVRAKTAPPPDKAAARPPPKAPANFAADALPDFGVALTNGVGAGGVAVGAPRAADPPAVTAEAKTLSRAGQGPAADECEEAPSKPKALSRPMPAYTEDARAASVSGKVRVEITVDERGRVVSVRVLEGLGHGLDEAAIAAARAMTFEPARRCGKPTTATFRVGFNFAPGTP